MLLPCRAYFLQGWNILMTISPKFTQIHIKEGKLHVNVYTLVDWKFLREISNNSNYTFPAYVKHHSVGLFVSLIWDSLSN